MLKQGTTTEIQQMFTRLRQETRNLIKEIVQLVYFMRGAIQYDDLMLMTPGEREIVGEFIKDRLEQESTKPYPQY